MKRCPTCKREFEDSVTYCLEDGTPLIAELRPDPDPSAVNTSAGRWSEGGVPATSQYGQLSGKETVAGSVNDIPMISSYGATPEKRRVWPWIAAGLAIVFLVAILIASVIAIPKLIGSAGKSDRSGDAPASKPADSSVPASSSGSGAPTDKSEVLTQLTELERQWTVANIEGDKVALERILADEYRGGDPAHTKQEYLDALQPDSTVKAWDFQDLRLRLNGDRATLDGYLRQETTSGRQVYSFTDEFIWRDGRWQATGSRTSRVR
jgi:hypothetical protein